MSRGRKYADGWDCYGSDSHDLDVQAAACGACGLEVEEMIAELQSAVSTATFRAEVAEEKIAEIEAMFEKENEGLDIEPMGAVESIKNLLANFAIEVAWRKRLERARDEALDDLKSRCEESR